METTVQLNPQIILVALALTAFVGSLVQLAKHTLLERLPSNWLPLVSLAIGAVVGAGLFATDLIEGVTSIWVAIVGGGLSGLAASGFYELADRTTVETGLRQPPTS